MIISPSRNFIFIHLEKCGGTSVETALQPYLHWSDMIIGSTEFGERYQQLYYDRFGREEVNKYMLWKHSTAKDIHAFIGSDNWNEFTKISVVRNPLELMKSLYYFSQTTVKYHIGRVNRSVWKDYLSTQNFPEAYPFTEKYIHAYIQSVIDGKDINAFIDLVLNNDYPFVLPQANRIMVDSLDSIDRVFDLSDIDNGWNEILNIIGVSNEIKLERLNASEKLEDVYISSRSIKLIKKHFAIDYDILPGYTGVHW